MKKVGFWQIFFGLGFLLAAAAVILNMFDVVTFGIGIGWLLLGILLALIAVFSLVHLQWFGVFLPAAGILNILIGQTNYLDFMGGGKTIGLIWVAAVLLSIGFSILFHRYHSGAHWPKPGGVVIGMDDKVINEKDEDDIFVEAVFGSVIKYVNTDDFKRAVLRCSFGALKVYFDDAKIKGDSANIEISCSLGGIELFIPKEWRVVDNLKSSMAAFDEKNRRPGTYDKKAKTVYLTGNLSMSGVEITYI